MRILRYLIAGITLIVVAPALTLANNLTISNVTIGSQNTTAHTLPVRFDIRWENSWRDSENYDAAWVFIKHSTAGGSTWEHATLAANGTNPAGFSNGSGTGVDIIVPPDKVGAFVQRSAEGNGTLAASNITFAWNYSVSSLSDADAANITLRAIGIEMVYIPTGAFDLGDGNEASESGNAFHSADNTKLTINSTLVSNIKCDVNVYDDAQIEISGIGINGTGGIDSDNDGTIDNAAFPTGYNAFYLMKYEVTSGQYCDFLNMLTRTQQNSRSATQANSTYSMSTNASVISRSVIRNQGSIASVNQTIAVGCDLNNNTVFNEAADGQWIAANCLSWADLAAYADWAALRPMTELEFEKACRGPVAAIYGEYAWGSTNITKANTLANAGQASETQLESGNGVCNYNNDGVLGPVRGGFAARSATTRAQAGASYWGVMELSGNLWERTVTVGQPLGRNFTGLHGNGALAEGGNADVTNWPHTNATGAGRRGGVWSGGYSYGRVSDRSFAAYVFSNRYFNDGGRLSRTSP